MMIIIYIMATHKTATTITQNNVLCIVYTRGVNEKCLR